MVIAVGFDGTCVTDDYPRMGKETGAAEALRKMTKNGHQIILFTKRYNRALSDAINWFRDNGINLYGVQEHPQWHTKKSPKCMADLYIDVRGLGCPTIHGDHEKPYVDWVKVEQVFELLNRSEHADEQ